LLIDFLSSVLHNIHHSRAPGNAGNENCHSRIPGNKNTRPGMETLDMALSQFMNIHTLT